jgi:hypothetical protein
MLEACANELTLSMMMPLTPNDVAMVGRVWELRICVGKPWLMSKL